MPDRERVGSDYAIGVLLARGPEMLVTTGGPGVTHIIPGPACR